MSRRSRGPLFGAKAEALKTKALPLSPTTTEVHVGTEERGRRFVLGEQLDFLRERAANLVWDDSGWLSKSSLSRSSTRSPNDHDHNSAITALNDKTKR